MPPTLDADRNLFAGNPLNRAANERKDDAWLQAQRDDPRRRILPIWQLRFPIDHAGDAAALIWLTPGQLAGVDGEQHLLGLRDGVPHFALDVSALEDALAVLPLPEGAAYRDLRGVAPELATEESGLAAQARSLVDWHARHGFCPNCGAATAPRQGGAQRVCSRCQKQHFPRTDPVVITLVHDGHDRCLLAGRARPNTPDTPPPVFTCVAGFIDQGETVEEAVRREVFEEVGVEVSDVTYQSSQPWPFPSSLMLSCRARASTMDITVDGDEIGQAYWFSRAQARALFDADYDPETAASADTPALRIPPEIAIAHHLIKRWAFEAD